MSRFTFNHYGYSVIGFIFVVVVLVGLLFAGHEIATNAKKPATTSSSKTEVTTKPTTPVVATQPVNPCANNSLSQLVLVSTSARHLWACDYQTDAYNSAVITGMDFLAADITPAGTYHIYAKEQKVYLKGSDSTGSWDDYVYYWMPFLDNQYGEYGLHDATWRAANAFGNISPDSNQASHGCVEMPLATAAWIYNWAVIGTTVTIES